jgi:hypothetical protein
MSLALHNIGTVHTGSCDPDEYLAGPGQRPWDFGNAHRTRIAGTWDHDRPHTLFSHIHIRSLS